MSNLFMGLFLLSILGLVVGLVKPSVVKLHSRGKVALLFGGAIIVFFILFGVTVPDNKEQSSVASTEVTASTSASQPPVQTTASQVAPSQSAPKKLVTQTPTPAPAPVVQPAPVTPYQPTVRLDISGSGTKSTQTFTVPSQWTMDYSYDCSNFFSKGNFQVSINTGNGSPTALTMVNELGASGSDTNYYHQGGTFYLEVNSECSWHVTVKG